MHKSIVVLVGLTALVPARAGRMDAFFTECRAALAVARIAPHEMRGLPFPRGGWRSQGVGPLARLRFQGLPYYEAEYATSWGKLEVYFQAEAFSETGEKVPGILRLHLDPNWRWHEEREWIIRHILLRFPTARIITPQTTSVRGASWDDYVNEVGIILKQRWATDPRFGDWARSLVALLLRDRDTSSAAE